MVDILSQGENLICIVYFGQACRENIAKAYGWIEITAYLIFMGFSDMYKRFKIIVSLQDVVSTK